jgi:DNA mismatch endonuclease (patch repair protein)
MRRIRAKNTRPEVAVRQCLHANGLRFRLHAPLPGRPDIVLPRWGVAIFVHGCFWHQHTCPAGRVPKSRLDFWAPKLEANTARDAKAQGALRAAGWRVLVVWECAVRGARATRDDALRATLSFVRSGEDSFREVPEPISDERDAAREIQTRSPPHPP